MRNCFSKASLKDSRRKILKTLNRYISIVAITALGVAFFSGLRATAPDMRTTAENYFKNLNFMDIRLISTVGFNDDDVSAIKSVSGLKGVMPGYSADAAVRYNNQNYNVKLESLNLNQSASNNSYINRPKVTEGRMPQNQHECLADTKFMKFINCKIGDKVTFNSGSSKDINDILKFDTFTIVGIAENPLYISYGRGTSSIGNGTTDAYFFIPSDAFSLSVYTDIYVVADNPKHYPIFSDNYDNKVLKPLKDTLSKISEKRKDIRFREIKKEAEDKIADAEKKVADSKQQLSDGQKKIDDSAKKISDGQKLLNSKKNEFEKQTAAAEKQLSAAQAEYEAGKKEYADKAAQLEQASIQYNEGLKKLNEAKEKLAALKSIYPAGSPEISALAAAIAKNEAELNALKATIDSGREQLASAKKTLDETGAKLAASRQELEKKKQESIDKINAEQKKLDNAKAQLEKSKADFEKQKVDAEKKIDEAQKKIADSKVQLLKLEKPVWYILDHNMNEGFSNFKQDADRIEAISLVFPLIFFLVAALVSLTCMTRLVEDDRGYIGTLKALGFSNGSIASKYLFYAISASLIGSLLGCAVGFQLFPNVIFDAYRILYTLPPIQADFNITYAVLSTCAAVFCAAFPAYLVCIDSLRETPASLMRQKAPRPGRKILLERITPLWKRLSFIKKVTARNLFRYKKRFFMTVIGVAGCTALVLTGFGLQDAITAIVSWQYDQIRTYDMEIDLKENISSEELSKIQNILDTDKNVTGSICVLQQAVDASNAGKTQSAYIVIPQDGSDLDNFIHLRERVGHKSLKLDDNSVIITEKLSTLLKLKAGDKITLRNSDGIEKKVKISGIAENYLFHYVYISPALYNKLYGKKPEINQILATISDKSKASEDSLSQTIIKQDGVSSVYFTTENKTNFQKMIKAVHSVVIILIISAAVLAFVVLFSLTSINIDERRRELAAIKVLGFYDNELAAYIYRENIILTIIGIAFGLLLGVVMERYVTISCEIDLVMFGRQINWYSFVYSAALTAAFAFFVNVIMYRRIKQVDMVTSLKSME